MGSPKAPLKIGFSSAGMFSRSSGAKRAWSYIAIWTVVPAQVVNWAAWRMGMYMGLDPLPLARTRLVICVLSTVFFFVLGYGAKLPRTQRYYTGVAAAGV